MPSTSTPGRSTGSPQRRAEVVASIRALADLIETNTDLPVPQSVDAQYSIFGDLTDEGRDLVYATARALGVEARIDDDIATAHLEVAHEYSRADGPFIVRYVIHGSRRQGGEQA
jgi:hypothetical protein